MSTALRPAPRSLVLAPGAWDLLVGAARGLHLPAPFGLAGRVGSDEDSEADADAAERALRRSGAAPGGTGDLLADLHPSLRAGLLVHLGPVAVVDTAVACGDDLVVSRHALAGPLVSGLLRPVRLHQGGRDVGAVEEARLGPVTLSALLVDDLAGAVLDLLPGLAERANGPSVDVDAGTSVAWARLLHEGRPELAAQLLDPAQAAVLRGLSGVLDVAQVQVAVPGASRRRLVAVRAQDGWAQASAAGGEVLLRPAGRDTLGPALVGVLAEALGGPR